MLIQLILKPSLAPCKITKQRNQLILKLLQTQELSQPQVILVIDRVGHKWILSLSVNGMWASSCQKRICLLSTLTTSSRKLEIKTNNRAIGSGWDVSCANTPRMFTKNIERTFIDLTRTKSLGISQISSRLLTENAFAACFISERDLFLQGVLTSSTSAVQENVRKTVPVFFVLRCYNSLHCDGNVFCVFLTASPVITSTYHIKVATDWFAFVCQYMGRSTKNQN